MKYKSLIKVFHKYLGILSIKILYRLIYICFTQRDICIIYTSSSKRYKNLSIIDKNLKQHLDVYTKSIDLSKYLNDYQCKQSDKSINGDVSGKIGNIEKIVKIFHLSEETGILKKCYCLATSKVIILDQADKILSRINIGTKTKCIQTWHGGGLYKKVGFDAFRHGHDKKMEEERVRRIYKNIDYFITSDRKLTEKYASIFRISKENIKPFGIPRTDLIYQRDIELDKKRFYELYPESKGKKIVVFSPTFRTYTMHTCHLQGEDIVDNRRNGRFHAYLLDFEQMWRNLGNEYFLILRKHPTVLDSFQPKGWVVDKDLPNDLIISLCDIMITDYSSILFDFCVTGKPVILFVPDLQEYETHDRGVYITPTKIVGDKNVFYDTESMIQSIRKNSLGSSEIIFRNFMSSCDGSSTNRVVDFIRSLL